MPSLTVRFFAATTACNTSSIIQREGLVLDHGTDNELDIDASYERDCPLTMMH